MTDNLFLTYYGADAPRLGLQEDDMLYALDDRLPSLEWLLSNASAGELLERALASKAGAVTAGAGTLRLPLGLQEVWAAGVTYKRSEEARERESHQSNMYTRVYHAERPELFFKTMGYEAVSSGQPVGIRCDSAWNVPEPELVIVLNARMEVVGFTIGNDMSSRDIEGENPLYLPQAKVYENSCALGPRIWLQPGAAAFPIVPISLAIRRDGAVVFEGETSSERIHRTLTDLVRYLGRCKRFPHGALLFTGTGIVPPDTFTLQAGDEVRIRIDPIGKLANPVTVIEGLTQKD